jgi:hypothetical protein
MTSGFSFKDESLVCNAGLRLTNLRSLRKIGSLAAAGRMTEPTARKLFP